MPRYRPGPGAPYTSGQLKPSNADKELTEQLKQASKLMEITLLDHMINGNDGYCSFEDEGV
jgi:DNA repair protein RadC